MNDTQYLKMFLNDRIKQAVVAAPRGQVSPPPPPPGPPPGMDPSMMGGPPPGMGGPPPGPPPSLQEDMAQVKQMLQALMEAQMAMMQIMMPPGSGGGGPPPGPPMDPSMMGGPPPGMDPSMMGGPPPGKAATARYCEGDSQEDSLNAYVKELTQLLR